MYITDWFATALSLAGLDVPDNVDSYNMWPSLSSAGTVSPRTEIILNIDMDNTHNTWSAAMM